MTKEKLEKRVFDNPDVKYLATPSKDNYNEVISGNDWITTGKSTITYRMKYFNKEKTILIIDFQYTADVNDWNVNFDFFIKGINSSRKIVKPYKGAKWYAHGGFVKGYKEVSDLIHEEIKNNINTIKYIIIRGYSQGGAYTILCTEDVNWLLNDINRNDIQVYGLAYAPPRVIFLLFSWNVRNRIKDVIIVKNYGDIVTHLPFVFLGFIHIGNMIKIGNFFRDIVPTHFNHFIEKYEEELKKYFE